MAFMPVILPDRAREILLSDMRQRQLPQQMMGRIASLTWRVLCRA
jgi:hypothetical protein